MKGKLLLFACLFALAAGAQEKWDLRRSVDYALANNISIKQADVQARIAKLQRQLTEANRIPTLNFNPNIGYNLGRSINPATNAFENRTIFFSGFQLQSGVTLFNWFSLRYAREGARIDEKAAEANTDRARNDIALNVAVAYLQALLAAEQVNISAIQIGQTNTQLDLVRRQVDAGTLPPLNAAELEAQLARDSTTYITAQNTYQQNIIQFKALLNLDMATPFDIEKPDVSSIPVESLGELQPNIVYAEAVKNLPQQRVNALRLQSAEQNIKSAKAAQYPSLSAFASTGTNYSSFFPDQTARPTITPTGKFDTLGFVQVNPTTALPAVRPQFAFGGLPNTPFGRQWFDVNLRQAVGLNLSVPILNGRQLRTNYQRAKLTAEDIRLQMDADNLRLQQDIYTAYTNAVNAVQRYSAAQKEVQTAEAAFGFSQKRYDVGLLQSLQLITNQNNLFRARLNLVSAQYEYVFRLKLLEFYKGRGLKL